MSTVKNRRQDRRKKPTENLMLEAEAAEFLGVSRSLLKKDRKEQTYGVPFIKLSPRKIRYVQSDLESWIQKKRIESQSTQAVRRAA